MRSSNDAPRIIIFLPWCGCNNSSPLPSPAVASRNHLLAGDDLIMAVTNEHIFLSSEVPFSFLHACPL